MHKDDYIPTEITDEQLREDIEKHPAVSRYAEWRVSHSHVYRLFRERCTKLVSRKRKFGIRLVTNVIRWNYYFEYDSEFKISHDFTSLIVRELMLEMPDMRKYCRIRKLEHKKINKKLM